jgi:hypothetical protein
MMDELETIDREPVDLAKNGAPKHFEGPRLVKGDESEPPGSSGYNFGFDSLVFEIGDG